MDPRKLIQTCPAHKPPCLPAQALRWIFSLRIASPLAVCEAWERVEELVWKESWRVRGEEESQFEKESGHLREGKEKRAEEGKEITSFWNALYFSPSPLPFIPNTTCGTHTQITSFFFIVQWHHWIDFCAIIMGPPTNHLASWLKSETSPQRDNHLQKRKLFLLLGAVKKHQSFWFKKRALQSCSSVYLLGIPHFSSRVIWRNKSPPHPLMGRYLRQLQ